MHPVKEAAPRRQHFVRRISGLILALGIAAAGLGLGMPQTASARGNDYDPTRAGNPLKIVYYAVYPAAFLVDRLIFRPAYYIGQWQPFHSLFGTTRPPVEVEIDDEDGANPDEDDS